MTIAWFDAMGRRVRDRVRREAVRRDRKRKTVCQKGSARGPSFKRVKRLESADYRQRGRRVWKHCSAPCTQLGLQRLCETSLCCWGCSGAVVNAINHDGETSLIAAVYWGNSLECSRILVEFKVISAADTMREGVVTVARGGQKLRLLLSDVHISMEKWSLSAARKL